MHLRFGGAPAAVSLAGVTVFPTVRARLVGGAGLGYRDRDGFGSGASEKSGGAKAWFGAPEALRAGDKSLISLLVLAVLGVQRGEGPLPCFEEA